MTPGFGGPWAMGVIRPDPLAIQWGVAGVAPEDGFDPWSRRRRGDRVRPIIVLAATIVIRVTKVNSDELKQHRLPGCR